MLGDHLEDGKYSNPSQQLMKETVSVSTINSIVECNFGSPSSSLCTVFDSTSSKIDEVLLINPSANVFVFEDFNIHQKDWLTYSGGIDRPGELCYNFSISNGITQMVTY